MIDIHTTKDTKAFIRASIAESEYYMRKLINLWKKKKVKIPTLLVYVDIKHYDVIHVDIKHNTMF